MLPDLLWTWSCAVHSVSSAVKTSVPVVIVAVNSPILIKAQSLLVHTTHAAALVCLVLPQDSFTSANHLFWCCSICIRGESSTAKYVCVCQVCSATTARQTQSKQKTFKICTAMSCRQSFYPRSKHGKRSMKKTSEMHWQDFYQRFSHTFVHEWRMNKLWSSLFWQKKQNDWPEKFSCFFVLQWYFWIYQGTFWHYLSLTGLFQP